MDGEINRRACFHGCRMFACTVIDHSTRLTKVDGTASQRYLVHHSHGTLGIFDPVFCPEHCSLVDWGLLTLRHKRIILSGAENTTGTLKSCATFFNLWDLACKYRIMASFILGFTLACWFAPSNSLSNPSPTSARQLRGKSAFYRREICKLKRSCT